MILIIFFLMVLISALLWYIDYMRRCMTFLEERSDYWFRSYMNAMDSCIERIKELEEEK